MTERQCQAKEDSTMKSDEVVSKAPKVGHAQVELEGKLTEIPSMSSVQRNERIEDLDRISKKS